MSGESSGFDEIEFTLALLAKNYDTHMNIVWATIVLLVGAIGWVITSREARHYIFGSRLTRGAAIVTVFFIAGLHYSLLYRSKVISQALVAKLHELTQNPLFNGTDELLVLSISDGLLVWRAAATLVLFAFLLFLLFKGSPENT